MANSIVRPLTGKALPPKSPTWSLTVARLSGGLLVLTLLGYAGLQAAVQKGAWKPPADLIGKIELGVAGMVVLSLLLAGTAVLRAFSHSAVRWRALRASALTIILGGVSMSVFAMNYLTAREAEAERARAEADVEQKIQTLIADKTSWGERGPRIAAAMHAASGKIEGGRKKTYEILATGLDSINPAFAAHDAAWRAFEQSGGLGANGLAAKGALAARRKLLQDAVAATRKYAGELRTIEAAWHAQLLPPETSAEERDRYIKSLAKDPLAAAERELAIASEMDATLASLQQSFGRWTVRKGEPVFKTKKDEREYRDRRGRVEALRTAQKTGVAAPAMEAIEENEARQYAMSYVALLNRGQLDEAYKYLPPEIRARVSAKDHSAHWQKVGALEKIAVDEAADVEGGPVGFNVAVPGKEPEVVVVLKSGGKVYSTPLAFLSK